MKIAVKSFLIAAIILGAYSFNRLGLLKILIAWIESLGLSAPVVFLLIYTVAAIFFVPSFLLTFAGGFLFNFWTVSILSVLGSGLGAVSAFLIGRYLARAAVEKWTSRNRPLFFRLAGRHHSLGPALHLFRASYGQSRGGGLRRPDTRGMGFTRGGSGGFRNRFLLFAPSGPSGTPEPCLNFNL